MAYLKWICEECESIQISNTCRRHQMDFCKCKKSGLDADEYIIRYSGVPYVLEEIDYNFYDELMLGVKEQGLLDYLELGLIKEYSWVYRNTQPIKDIEDELIKELIES